MYNLFVISLLIVFLSKDYSQNHFSAQDEVLNIHQTTVSESCEWKGFKLYGRIQYVESFPDIKIQFVNSFPDLRVQFVESFPDQCGKWQVVTLFPDIKVQVVESFPDVKVQVVNSFPGR